MKKLFIFLGVILLVSGCGKNSDSNIVKELNKKVEKVSSYHMTGTLEIYRNEDKYTYEVDSSYKKGDLFKVNLKNTNNNHEQIILKNSQGIYVITPSLNKSFKFQSDWPYNNSQIYLLQPVFTDLDNDKNTKCEKNNTGYILTSKVNYSSEKEFKKQKVYLDKDKNVTKIEVLDNDKNVKMTFKIINIEYDKKFDDDYFDVSKYQLPETKEEEKDVKENKEETTDNNSTTSKIDEIVYPMYVPADTQLSGQDVVDTVNGERVILTFTGESSFTVVQEALSDTNKTSIDYVYGDPYLILDTVGSITDSSVTWISNGIEYSVLSDSMNIDELLTVAQSISVKAVGK